MKTYEKHTGKAGSFSAPLHKDETLIMSSGEARPAVSITDSRHMTEEKLQQYQAEAELHDVREKLRIAEEALERFGFFRYRSPLGWHPPAGKDKLSMLFRLTHDMAALERDRNHWMEMHGDMVGLYSKSQAENAELKKRLESALVILRQEGWLRKQGDEALKGEG